MIDLVENRLAALQSICKTRYVKNLFLFGSAATGSFNALTSDIDLAVEFEANLDPLNYAQNYFGLLEDLQSLLGRKIDLLSLKALKNPVLIQEIENSKVQLYAA